MISTVLGAAGRMIGAETLSASAVKTAVKRAAIEKVKSGISQAPGAIFDAAGGNKVPLLRHGVKFAGQVRDNYNQTKSVTRLDHAKEKREDAEEKNALRQRRAHDDAVRELDDETTRILSVISSDLAEIKEFLIQPNTKEKSEGSGLLAKLVSLVGGIGPMITAALGGGGLAAMGSKLTSLLRGGAGGVASAGRALATTGASTVSKASGVLGKVGSIASKMGPGVRALGRAAPGLAIGAGAYDIAKNGANVKNVGDTVAGGAMFVPGVGQAAGAGWAAGRLIDEGILDRTRAGRAGKLSLSRGINSVANLFGMGVEDDRAQAERLRKLDEEGKKMIAEAKARRAALVAKTPELSGTSDTSLSLASVTTTGGKPKSIADLLNILVRAATTEDEGIFIRPAKEGVPTSSVVPQAKSQTPSTQPRRRVEEHSRSADETLRQVNGRAMNSGQRSGYEPPVLSNRTGMPAAMTGVDAFADLIGRAESRNDYSAFNDTYTDQSGRRRVKARYNTNLTDMTLGEVMSKQKAGDIFAAGRYQVIPNTLREAVQSLGLDPSQKFDQSLQDRIFKEYLITKKRPEIGAFLSGKGSEEAAMLAASREWASVGVAPGTRLNNGRIARGGESYYAGDGLNSAHIKPEQVRSALLASRNAARDPVPNMQTPSGNFLASLNQTLSGPKPQQSSMLYDANRKAEKADNRPIIVQPAPVITQGAPKSRGGRSVGGAQVAMNTRNPDPAIRQFVLGWMGSTV